VNQVSGDADDIGLVDTMESQNSGAQAGRFQDYHDDVIDAENGQLEGGRSTSPSSVDVPVAGMQEIGTDGDIELANQSRSASSSISSRSSTRSSRSTPSQHS